jgi:nucleoside-diphosphate-sugar epimerase
MTPPTPATGGRQSFWRGRGCLVTGYGFGGSHLAVRLVELGAEVTVLDVARHTDGFLVRSGLSPQVRFVQADIRDEASVGAALARGRTQAVFHLAAQPLVPRSVAEPAETLDVNARGTFTLLEAFRRAATVESFILASTGGYYGENYDERPLREQDPARAAANLYGASKIAADVAVQAYARTYGLPATVCRFMNTYGPGDTHTSRLIPRALQLLAHGEPYDFGDRDDGSTRLDFLYVGDMVEGYLAAAEALANRPGTCYNFGTRHTTAVRDVAYLVSEAFDGLRREPVFRGHRRERGLVKRLDVAKAETELGWRARVPLVDGIAATVQYARQWSTA